MAAVSRRRELLSEASELVATLRAEQVRRTEVTPVVNVLLFAPGSWKQRRKRAADIARHLPSSWLKERSSTMPRRLVRVKEVVLDVLVRHEDEQETRFVLGWLLRLMKQAEARD